jgi:hypothetical protein
MNWGVMAGHLGWGIIEEEDWRKGPWTAEEDRLLIEYVRLHGEGRWNSVARLAGNNSAPIQQFNIAQNSVTCISTPFFYYLGMETVTGSQLC